MANKNSGGGVITTNQMLIGAIAGAVGAYLIFKAFSNSNATRTGINQAVVSPHIDKLSSGCQFCDQDI